MRFASATRQHAARSHAGPPRIDASTEVHTFGVLLANALRAEAVRAESPPVVLPQALRRLLLAALSTDASARPSDLSSL
ncbi:MAG: hypothetical protein JWN48_4512, partial [Myxococcaceae bacterium]|nr:hypothetical protein [Myxococcaceae bacterium]